ncbi:MAG TPA: hypothetical protein VK610_06430, partial [Rhodothermales bacterium]|nr:hypothetical protein [Rhodothermales bacterium]
MTPKPLALLALAFLVAACSSGRLPDPPEADRSRGFQAIPEVVRTAARAHFEAEGFRPVAGTARGGEAWERAATGSGALIDPSPPSPGATVAVVRP